MGNKPIRPVLPPQDIHQRLSKAEIAEIKQQWQDLTGGKGDAPAAVRTLSQAEFLQQVLPADLGHLGAHISKRVFDVVNWKRGKTLDHEEFLCYKFVVLFGSEEHRLRFLFNLFDSSASESVSKNQFKSTSAALFEMHGSHGGFSAKAFSKMMDAYVYFAFLNYDLKNEKSLSFARWCRFADEDESVMGLLRLMGRLAPPPPAPGEAFVAPGSTPIVE